MIEVQIKQVKDGRHPLPKYAREGDAGMDFKAYLANTVQLRPMQRTLIPLGVAVAIPEGYELQLRPKSGLALNKGISLVNTPGTIDSGYRGELGAIVINLGSDTVEITDGMNICQGVLNEFKQISFTEVTELGSTDRGEGGFGSTSV